jgi:protocatechuate 3,4-dioxygenase beta subunit
MKSNRRRLVASALIIVVALAAGASPSRMVIAPPGEPGERLVVTGRVFGPDGHPIAGIEVYAYHTDANGYYRADHKMHGPLAPPRLEGRLRTAPDGSYRIDTIKPAPYPSRTVRAHIHFKFHGGGLPDQNGTLWFEADHPLPRDAAGVLHCTRDFHLGNRAGAES